MSDGALIVSEQAFGGFKLKVTGANRQERVPKSALHKAEGAIAIRKSNSGIQGRKASVEWGSAINPPER